LDKVRYDLPRRSFMSDDAKILLSLYRIMATIRKFETLAGDMFAADRTSGFIHLSIGQEASSVGVFSVLRPDDFVTCAMDEIVNQTAKIRYMFGGQIKVPLVIWAPDGVGLSAAAHHSQSLESWFIHTPGLKVVVPSKPSNVKGLLKAAIRDDDPIIFFQHKKLFAKEGPVPEVEHVVTLGKAAVKRSGNHVTILTYGSGFYMSMEAAKELTGIGIEAEVIDLRTLKPFDFDTVADSIKKTNRDIVVHEACLSGGFGAEVAAKDVPMPFSPRLEDFVLPKVEDVTKAIRQVTYR
jgi:pyruvate dehydrogenase E1 component beta subunit